jgi:hypothetical protein
MIAATRILSYRVFFFTLYSLGLRLGEGLRLQVGLQVGDIDAVRGRVHVRDAKGNKDRFVPLPTTTLQMLRNFWRVHRNPVLLFPNRQSGLKGCATATTPLDRGGVQITLRQVALDCGLKKDYVTLPAAQLCNPLDRSWRRPDRGPEIPGPPFDSHHRPLHPPDRPDQASRHRHHQRPDEQLHRGLAERQMIRLATVIDRFKADFLAQYRHQLSADQLHALSALARCRNQGSLKMQVRCADCEHQVLAPHSCGHRHCPHCQHHESQQRLERQVRKQLPAEYFLLTFTLPAELRALCWSNQKAVYDLLLRASWETVHRFSQNDKKLRGTPGAIAVLHTHSRRLDYHPHVHLVMPAAAIDAQKTMADQARCQRLPVQSSRLAKVFRAKVLAGLTAAGLRLPARYPGQWVVDCKSVGSGEKALVYLGRYLYRGVIREKDIVACGDGQVSFRFQNAKTGKAELRTVTGARFLWLVLQHVLPKGLRRARNFGFLHPNCKRLIALLQLLLKFVPSQGPALLKPRAPILCPCCGTAMAIVRTRGRAGPTPAVVSRSTSTM